MCASSARQQKHKSDRYMLGSATVHDPAQSAADISKLAVQKSSLRAHPHLSRVRLAGCTPSSTPPASALGAGGCVPPPLFPSTGAAAGFSACCCRPMRPFNPPMLVSSSKPAATTKLHLHRPRHLIPVVCARIGHNHRINVSSHAAVLTDCGRGRGTHQREDSVRSKLGRT
jgi:hypothetical protein